MSFMLFRTIWITLRASNYTTRAFEDTIRGMKKLQREQLKFKMNAAKNIFAVGTMYLAFGVIAGFVMAGVMNASKAGQRVMENFGKRVGKSMEKLSTALAAILRPMLDIVASVLEFAVAIPLFKEVAAVAMILGTGFLIVMGITKVFGAAMAMLSIKHMAAAIAVKLHAKSIASDWTVATKVATVATYGLGQALLFVGAGFAVAFGAVFMVYQIFGKLPAIILGVVIAMVALLVVVLALANVLTLGMATKYALVGAAVGGLVGAAAVASMPEHQMGTSFVREGGYAKVHAGEEIISARESRVHPRWEKGQELVKRSYWNVNVTMENVHTKADEETMIPLLKRALKESLDNK